MINSFGIYFFRLFALAATFIVIGSPLAATANDPAQLELHWEIPLRHGPFTSRLPPQRGSVINYARTTNDAIVLFEGNSFADQISSFGSGGEPIHVEVDARLYAITPATGGGVFVAGGVSHWHIGDIFRFKENSTDAFVARINSSGDVIWRKDVGGAGLQVGLEIIELVGGNIVVSGSNGYETLLWSFSANGSLRWEQRLGRRGGRIAPLSSGGLAVVGSEPQEGQDIDEEDIMLWILDKSGQILHSTVVRKTINTRRGSRYLNTTIAANPDAIILSTAWSYPRDLPLLEIAKYDVVGNLLWTVVPEEQNCRPAPMLEATGDVVVACANSFDDASTRKFTLTRFSEGGISRTVTSTLPDCQQHQTAVIMRVLRSDPIHTLILGSRPQHNRGKSCTWLGRLSNPLQ